MKTALVEQIPTSLRKPGILGKITRICKENDVIYMVMFGSYVRGEQRRGSDIDIGVEYRKDAHKSLFDLLDLQEKLTNLFRHKVDLGIFSTLRSDILDEVKKEMVVLYDTQSSCKRKNDNDTALPPAEGPGMALPPGEGARPLFCPIPAAPQSGSQENYRKC